MDINQITISGRIAKINDVKNEGKNLTFTIAYNKRYREPNGEYIEKPFFFFCSLNGKTRVDYFLKTKNKGSNLVIFGALENYENDKKELNHVINIQNFK